MMRRNPSTRNQTRRISAVLCAIVAAFLARPATATDLAILRNGFSIRHEHRLVMGNTTRLFLSADDSSFIDEPTEEFTGYEKDLLAPATADLSASSAVPSPAVNSVSGRSMPLPSLNEVVNNASANYHLDPDLVNSVIHAESGFNVHAVSPKGARGLMQLMPSTASQLGVADAFDPQANVEGGSRYLRELLERYNFDLVKALAAYNAGPERVEQYQGVPPFRETRAYVARIVHEYNKKKTAQEKEAKQKLKLASAPSRSQKASQQSSGSRPAPKALASAVVASGSH